MPNAEDLKAAIRDVPDFPKEGITFKDITPILGSGPLFRSCMELLAETAGSQKIDKVVGIDARGFIFAAGVAQILGAGFVPVRKAGKHEDAVQPGEKVLLIDDLLATGGTAAAAVKLLNTLEADIVAVSFLIELSALGGRPRIEHPNIQSIITY